MSNIINKVTYENYTHWIEYFVQRVLTESNVDYEEVVITKIEHNKFIFLSIDKKGYFIRVWNFMPENEIEDADMIRYILYKEEECIKMVSIFEFMKFKKWLSPYNAPKFRQAYSSVYLSEYRKISKRLGKGKKKNQMYSLYKKYYQIFIKDNQYEYWLHRRDGQDKKLICS